MGGRARPAGHGVTDPDYLDLEDLLHLVQALGVGPVRDPGLLDSAAHRPQATVLGDDAYPTLSLKAGALLHSLTRNHALVDGNKRLAWLAVAVFADLNGREPKLTDDEAFRLVMDIAEGLDDVEQVAAGLRLGPT